MAPKSEPESVSVRPGALTGKKCIITGEIAGQTRKSAESILIKAGATIEKSLNKQVQLVVLGENAGPQKLEKIKSLGIETKEWEALIDTIKCEGAAEATSDGDDRNVDASSQEESMPPSTVTQAVSKTASKGKSTSKAKATQKSTPAPTSKSSNGFELDYLSGKTVIVTGTIPDHDRKGAQSMLEDAGAVIAKSLNKQVEMVVLGTNPGPDKLQKIKDLGVETIEWADIADKLGIEVSPEKEVASVDAGEAPSSVEGITMLITGEIDGHTRSSAQKLLEGAGAKFAKSLNKSVELVVLGANAGPDKLSKISEQGIPTCEWQHLVAKLGLDAEAEQPPPKKKVKKT